MKKIWIVVLLLLLSLFSCSRQDDLKTTSSAGAISASLYVIPEAYIGTSNLPDPSGRFDTIGKDDLFALRATLLLNDAAVADEEWDDIAVGYFWVIDGDTVAGTKWQGRLSEAGFHLVVFHVYDPYLDTLKDTLYLLVDTHPGPISINVPQDSSRGLDPWNSDGLRFSWSIPGIDVWEHVLCDFHLGQSIQSLSLNSPMHTRANMEITLPDSLFATDQGEQTWYAQVVCFISADPTTIYDSLISQPMQFSLRDPLSDLSKLSGTVVLLGADSYSGVVASSLEGILASDTSDDQGHFQITGLRAGPNRIAIQVPDKPEYQPETLSVDLYPGTTTILDTLQLVDLFAPQVHAEFVDAQTLRLLVRDQGSGIDMATLKVFFDEDDISDNAAWDGSGFNFQVNRQDTSHLLVVSIADFAGNQLQNDSLVLEAP